MEDPAPYVDPILTLIDNDNSLKGIQSLSKNLPPNHHAINEYCSKAIIIYKNLISLNSSMNSWEFLTLKTAVNLNFSTQSNDNNTTRKFDIKIAKKILSKCNVIDDAVLKLDLKLSKIIEFISKLTIEEYLADSGCLLLKIYFKILNSKNELVEKISIYYTKSKLLIISYELQHIIDSITPNSMITITTDFQSTLESYKDFVAVLISQLDSAVEAKDKTQIEECLNILQDVEKMYESVRVNFFINEEYNDWTNGIGYKEEDNASELSRRYSMSSTTSSVSTLNHPTTITEELPFLLQAFDEAKTLEQEVSSYQSPSRPSTLKKTPSHYLGLQEKKTSNLHTFITPNTGFSSPMLNSIYGLSPKTNLHNEVD